MVIRVVCISSDVYLFSHYEIQPEGPVQQIAYATEKESALLRLIKEEDARRSVHVSFSLAWFFCCMVKLLLENQKWRTGAIASVCEKY